MWPALEASPGTSHTVKMLAIMMERDVESGRYTDNTNKYLSLVLIKLGMDAVVFYLCCCRTYKSFLNMCSLSVVLADVLMAFFLATMWLLGPGGSPVSLCVILAHASATYAVVPLPMMLLGLLDHCLQDTCLCNLSTLCKITVNAALVLLGWLLAVIYSFVSVDAKLIELDSVHTRALVCEVAESTLITYFVFALFTAVICALLPFSSSIPRWMSEADRLSEAREEEGCQSSDLSFITATEAESSGEDYLGETFGPRPPLWCSLALCFGAFWLPYLAAVVACMVFGFGAPAYISVNLMWLESTNSFLMGVVFWAKSSTQGPYSRLPENVCLWHVYWHLSKGTQQKHLPVAVFNPSKAKRTTLFYV